MNDNPTVIVDRVRASQFAVLGSVPALRLFECYETWTDGEGIVWAGKKLGNHGVAVTWLGQGWVFDSHAAKRRVELFQARNAEMQEAGGKTHALELASLLGQLRLSGRSERLLWLIHWTVIAMQKSAFRLPDYILARAVWGEEKPPHWRQELLHMLETLSWLHLTDWPEDFPLFGQHTALLTHVADLRKKPGDACGPDCPGHLGLHHHHYLINVGRGFLGVLEQFAKPDDGSGVRHYDFPIGDSKSEGPSLWKVGKSGRLASVFLPAKLGDPAACARFSKQQHRLLQAIRREATRTKKKDRREFGEVEVFTGNQVKAFHGMKRVACPMLSPTGQHIGFNGNRMFKGKGYKHASTVGWLVKAGYALDETGAFLDDLAALAGPLGLIVVGIGRGSQFFNLKGMQCLAVTPQGQQTLNRLHVRIFTTPDYLERWNGIFKGKQPCAENVSHGTDAEVIVALLDVMKNQNVSLRKMAKRVGVDASFMSKLLKGKKPWPKDILEKIQKWAATQKTAPKSAKPRTSRRKRQATKKKEVSILDEALHLLNQGWSVVPQRPGMKQPCIRWKPYQERLPTEEEWVTWFEEWPDAGLALVLGPVSGIFVIDVDGEEAHNALLNHLGKEPLAPKAISGSGKPYRYHLYFRCPDLPTKAKQTPWHPNLEFRGKGGIVIIPPSLHPSGKRYAWAPGQSPNAMEFSKVPSQVLNALTPLRPVKKAPRKSRIKPVAGIDASPRTLEFLSGKWSEGPGWNDKLFHAACDLCGRDMPLEEGEPLLLAGAHPWSVGDEELARRTIASAYSQPRAPAHW